MVLRYFQGGKNEEDRYGHRRHDREVLGCQGISYEVVAHRHTGDSLHTAEAAHVSGESVAKAVVLEDEQGYIVAVLPATYKLKIGELHAFTGRRHLRLVSEEALAGLFKDCEIGAVPALAAAYGLEAVWDESLALSSTLYFEGGDHQSLVRVSGADFASDGDANCGALGEPCRSTLSFHQCRHEEGMPKKETEERGGSQ
jgi:Ala-tRNA(Pro) deacylase